MQSAGEWLARNGDSAVHPFPGGITPGPSDAQIACHDPKPILLNIVRPFLFPQISYGTDI